MIVILIIQVHPVQIAIAKQVFVSAITMADVEFSSESVFTIA